MHGTYHCDQTKVSFFLEIRFYSREASSSGLGNSLDQKTFTNSEFYANVIGAELYPSQWSILECHKSRAYTVDTEVDSL
jgi:hypothetical protein